MCCVFTTRHDAGNHQARTHLNEQPPQHDVKPHQIPRVRPKDLSILPARVRGSGAHPGRDGIARGVDEQLREPLEDALDLLRLRFVQVRDAEGDADIADAAGDFAVGEGHEAVFFVALLAGGGCIGGGVRGGAGGAADGAGAGVVGHCCGVLLVCSEWGWGWVV